MLKKVLFLFAFCAVAVFFYMFFTYSSGTPLHQQTEKVQTNATAVSVATPANRAGGSPSGLDLAMKSINLSQGEDGFELWRLRASAASIVKKDEFIFLESPRLVYFMKDGTELKVVSDRGEIHQEQQIINFIDNVVVTRENSTITGSMLVYNGTAKTMTFPRGGIFDEPESRGKAHQIIWHINNKEIVGVGNVEVDFVSEVSGSPRDASTSENQLPPASAKPAAP